MTQTVTRLYDSYDTALRAMLALKEAGFTDRETSLLVNREAIPATHTETAETGASLGGVIGAAAGLMAGMGVIAIPGLGPVVAAGWLAPALAIGAAGAVAGGAAGGLVGALTDDGTSEEEAQTHIDGVRRGDTLVTVRAPNNRAIEAASILASFEADASGVDPVLPAGLPSQPPR